MQHLYNIDINPLDVTDITYLSQPFSPVDIKKAVWKLGAWKAHRPDGIPIGFYKENWDLVGPQITHTTLSILSGQTTLQQINYIDLVFIPKTKHTQTVADFRQIGLCNTMYKILSKTIHDRLSAILPLSSMNVKELIFITDGLRNCTFLLTPST